MKSLVDVCTHRHLGALWWVVLRRNHGNRMVLFGQCASPVSYALPNIAVTWRRRLGRVQFGDQ